MSIIENIKNKARSNIKKIILPEMADNRVLKAASICQKENIANIILIGDSSNIPNDIDLSGVEIINPLTYENTTKMINELYEMRKEKGLTYEEAKELILNNSMYFACMLLHNNYADGIVSGACHSTSDTLKPALQIIKTSADSKIVSAFFLMEVPNCEYGYNGTFIFSDAGLVPNPNSEELAEIAFSSSKSFEQLVCAESKTAFLSFSSKGSAKHADVLKVQESTKLTSEKYPDMLVDGELQLDAAIDEDVAKIKAPDSPVAGHANVLIFPDLDAGNIGYKLVQRLAKAEAYGPITQGMKKPVNDLSRGCSVDDIVGVVAITSVQAK